MKRIIIISLVFFSIQGFSQEPTALYPYSINLEDTILYDFSFLDSTIANYDAFFVGDSHGFYSDVAIEFQLLMYLYKKQNVRYFVCERGVGGGYALDKFVTEGDSTYFKYSVDARWQ